MNNKGYNIEKIVNYLEPYKKELIEEELFRWDPSWNTLEKIIPEDLKKNGLKNYVNLRHSESYIMLKKCLKNILSNARNENNDLYKKLRKWIIQDWGRIKLGKENELEKLIVDFIKSDGNPSFKRIASSSKVASFLFPEKYIIYDSRVSYSLNWILLSQNAGEKYFPIPEGRNSKMNAFDVNVFIRLKHKKKYYPVDLNNINDISEIDEQIFVNKTNAYSELNNLVKSINDALWEEDVEKKDKPYYTEMLLFSIADNKIYQDITRRANLNF